MFFPYAFAIFYLFLTLMLLYFFRSENWFGSWLNAAKNKVNILFNLILL